MCHIKAIQEYARVSLTGKTSDTNILQKRIDGTSMLFNYIFKGTGQKWD